MARIVPYYVTRVITELNELQEVEDGWKAKCPCSYHGVDGVDQSPSLHVTVGDKGRVLIYCQAGCNVEDILTCVGLEVFDLFPADDDIPCESLKKDDDNFELSKDEELFRHEVYQTLLSLSLLQEEQRVNLLARGFNEEQIASNQYRSFIDVNDLAHLVATLFQMYGDRLATVPGFWLDINGVIKHGIYINAILIPVRNVVGLIVAIKQRTSLVSPKYVYLTSGKNGKSPGAPVHCPSMWLEDRSVVRVTEGELKADISTAKSNIYTISVPGVTNWWKALRILDELKPSLVLLAFDAPDVATKPNVRHQLKQLNLACKARNFETKIESWDTGCKGIDDALVAGLEIQRMGDEVLNSFDETQAESPVVAWVPMPFPTQVFPEKTLAFIQGVAGALPCPADFPAVAALTIVGTMIGTSRRLEVKGGWDEQPNLYSVIVANPGCLKTPALMHAMNPVRKIQSQLSEEYKARRRAHEHLKMLHKAKMTAYRSELQHYYANLALYSGQGPAPVEPSNPGEEPELRPLEHIWADDATTEALAPMLEASARGLILFCDELVAWVRSFNQFKGGKGRDRQFWLSAWSGSPIKVDRKGSDNPISIENPFLAVLGSIQPDLLEELVDDKGRKDGFVDRILFSIPEADPAPPFTQQEVSPEVRAGWRSVVYRLRSYAATEETTVIPGNPPTEMVKQVPKVLHFTMEAKAKFETWNESHRQEVRQEDFPRQLQGPWSKLRGYIIRFILILHMLRCAEDETDSLSQEFVDEEDVTRAILLINYYKNHAQGVYKSMVKDSQGELIDDFIKWVKVRGNKVTLREVYRSSRWGVRTKSEAKKFLQAVEDRGLGNFGSEKNKNNVDRLVFTTVP